MSKLDRPFPQSPVKNGDSEGTENLIDKVKNQDINSPELFEILNKGDLLKYDIGRGANIKLNQIRKIGTEISTDGSKILVKSLDAL